VGRNGGPDVNVQVSQLQAGIEHLSV
jgi:hypothetical protein